MQGIIQKNHDLRNASLAEIRDFLQELEYELKYRFSTLSKDNFDERDLRELGAIILSDNPDPDKRTATITIKDGRIDITGNVYINGTLQEEA